MLLIDTILRGTMFILIFSRILYWLITAVKADQEKPKSKYIPVSGKLKDYILYLCWIILGLQLLGLKIFSFPHNTSIQLIGFLLCLTGVVISILGRYALGTNWTQVGEAQVKRKHALVMTGIYRYIRHPIYSGVFLAFVGGGLVAESYLAVFCFILFFYGAYKEGKREETLLRTNFGKKI